jgi:hypothetical protein
VAIGSCAVIVQPQRCDRTTYPVAHYLCAVAAFAADDDQGMCAQPSHIIPSHARRACRPFKIYVVVEFIDYFLK